MSEASRICSWKIAFALDNPIRRIIHNPQKILGGYIEPGQTVLDLGCGPGTFSLAMANMVGESGKVIAVDVQEEMLQIVREKAARQGRGSIIVTHKSGPDRIGLSEKVDFALAFYMVHEVPNAESFLKEVAYVLKPKGKLLIVEPKMHVSAAAFEKTIDIARQAGLKPISEPKIRFSRSKLLSL
ncbi:MAG: methyltransferase domain-containing protein [Methanothrix sp.]